MNRISIVIFTVVFVITCTSLSYVAQAGEASDEARCSAYNAEYVPSTDYKPGEPALNYRITIEGNEDYVPSQYGTKLFFILDTYDAGNGVHLSTFRVPYNCAGGAIPMCALEPMASAKGEVTTKLYVASLRSDFTSAQLSDEAAPYALIIPNSTSVFYRLQWERVKTIKYHTGDNDDRFNMAHRPIFVPPIWVLKGCNAAFENNPKESQGEVK